MFDGGLKGIGRRIELGEGYHQRGKVIERDQRTPAPSHCVCISRDVVGISKEEVEIVE